MNMLGMKLSAWFIGITDNTLTLLGSCPAMTMTCRDHDCLNTLISITINEFG
jgi:hypothetical protein